jgi:hypothetical protein
MIINTGRTMTGSQSPYRSPRDQLAIRPNLTQRDRLAGARRQLGLTAFPVNDARRHPSRRCLPVEALQSIGDSVCDMDLAILVLVHAALPYPIQEGAWLGNENSVEQAPDPRCALGSVNGRATTSIVRPDPTAVPPLRMTSAVG